MHGNAPAFPCELSEAACGRAQDKPVSALWWGGVFRLRLHTSRLDFDESVADARFIAGLVERRRAVHEAAVVHAEDRPVPRTRDRAVMQIAFGQRPALVRASLCQR